MNTFKTPSKDENKQENQLIIPPSPFMKCLGFGTGVSVYKLNRSPISSKTRSPWAIKKIMQLKTNVLLRKRLMEEASVLKKLNHPNVVGFRAFTEDDKGKMCLAMEACTISLGDLIEQRNDKGKLEFPAVNIAAVSSDIAKALDYLHNNAYILHCDIKSYNILIRGDFETCKLCDFGISLPLQPDGTVLPKYLREACLGTGPWMAPEAILDETVTTKSDVYSYGLVIWEMIALTVPPPNEDTDADYLDMSSELNDSQTESNSHDYKCVDWRPELPARDFSRDYDQILELFYCCTMKDSQYRPSAELLVKANSEILTELS